MNETKEDAPQSDWHMNALPTRCYPMQWRLWAAVLMFCASSGASLLPDPALNILGAGRSHMAPVPLGALMPEPAPVPAQPEGADDSAGCRYPVVQQWSESNFPDWKQQGKVTAPRVILAKLACNRDIEESNNYLMNCKPWSGVGSNWLLFKGDYDFTLTTLTTVLYLFGNKPERLYPQSCSHLVEVLLTEEGATPLLTVPRSYGLILDTENHQLMTEGSRYLKNQWLKKHKDKGGYDPEIHDNDHNGLGAWLEAFLELLIQEGIYEFNAIPYAGYTIQALLNLDAFAESAAIRSKARYLLDIMNLQYALGSLDLRRSAPFRRLYSKAATQSLNGDPHRAYMAAWLQLDGYRLPPEQETDHYSTHAVIAALLPYRLPRDVARWTLAKESPYELRFGRGPSACPEIYSGGPGYLLSAGGANRGFRSHIIARPMTLLLADGATQYEDCFYITGKGRWFSWNATGLWSRFACANGSVHVPAAYSPIAEGGGWRVYTAHTAQRLFIAVYDQDGVGLLALFPGYDDTAAALLKDIRKTNENEADLQTRFTGLDGTVIHYDLNAPKGTWVIKGINDHPVDRDYDHWPQLDGTIESLHFSRAPASASDVESE
ncbi:MAG: hypothetical protein ACOYI9_00715 [Candidatus Hydrogenedentales bacterium]